MIVILLSTAIPIFSQCPHNKVVGSGVGISTLSQALSSGVLTINGAGEVIGSFCINGTFDLNIGKNFRNVSILCLSGSILRKNTLPHPGGIQQAVIFFYSSIEGLSGSQLVVENGSNYSHSILAFVGGYVENFPEVRMDNYASIILSSGAAFAHNKKVLVDNHSVLINYGSLFLESPVEADHSSTVASYTGSIFETDCMEETCAPAISLKQNSSLVARGTAFFDSYLGIDCTNCAVINLFESEVNTLVGINSLNNLNYFDIKSSYVGDQNTEFGTAANMSNEINIENSGLKSGYYVPLGIEDVGKLDIHSNPDIYGEKIIIGNAVQGKIENNNFDSGIWLNDCNLDMLGNQIHGSPFNTIWDYTSIGGHSGLIYDNWFFDGCSLETPMETYFECNYLVGVSDFGYSFELSDGMDVSVKANKFSSTIFIENDFIPQINQGNKFEIGVHGAEGVAVDVNTSFFKVADDPAEFPSHTPAGLFINTGKTNVCGGGIVNDDDDKNKCFGPYLKYKLKLVKKLLACSKQSLAIKGKCHANIKLALQIIKKCPNLLSDSLINVEYYKFIESDFNKLYNFDVLQSKLYSQKSTLVYPNINFSEISNLDELQEGLSVFNSLNQINDDRYQILINKINVETAFLNSIYLMEPSVINYRNALIWYLEIKAGIFPDQNRINDIKTLANDCEENGSPGSKLAKLLCKSLRLEYNDSECNDVEGRVNLNDENSDKFKIWPNPTNGIINIESNSYLDVIEIFSVYGIKVSDAIILSDNKIDVSYLEPGIYILRPKGQSNVIKFIKID